MGAAAPHASGYLFSSTKAGTRLQIYLKKHTSGASAELGIRLQNKHLCFFRWDVKRGHFRHSADSGRH